MKTKYLLLKPTTVNEKTLLDLDDRADDTRWEAKSRDLQARRWRKLNRKLQNEEQTI